jgi:hypothetical protein
MDDPNSRNAHEIPNPSIETNPPFIRWFCFWRTAINNGVNQFETSVSATTPLGTCWEWAVLAIRNTIALFFIAIVAGNRRCRAPHRRHLLYLPHYYAAHHHGLGL